MNKFTKQCAAAFASLAMAGTLCVAGAVVAGNVAFADNACNSGAPWNTACAQQKGSITIKKYEDKGNEDKSTPLKGAKFKVQRVIKVADADAELDLTNYNNWETLATKVKSLNDNPNVEGMKFDSSNTKEGETNQDGKVEFSDLKIGLYKVEEIQPAPKHANDVTPFYMTIPEITHAAGQPIKYDYNVTVEPKNQSLANKIKKELITDTANQGTAFVGAGDTMTYKISADVLSVSDTVRAEWTKADLIGYNVFDDAPVDAFQSYENVVQTVKIGTDTIDASKYEVKIEDVKNENSAVVAKRIKVSFKDEGLEQIANKAKGDTNAKVEVKLAFKINDNRGDSKTDVTALVNKSGFTPGKSKEKKDPNPEVPEDTSSKVENKFGYLQVNKYDGTDSTKAKKVQDAKFKLFAVKSDADKCAANTNANECNSASKVGELTTNANGAFDNAVKVKAEGDTNKFYLVETEAPAQYERDQQVHEVLVNAAETKTIDIANVPTKDNGSWFKLPKTGAYGVIIFALTGMCLVAIGMFIFLRNRKKEEERQSA